MSTSTVSASAKKAPPQPMLDGKKPRFEFLIVHVFVLIPMLALAAAVPLAWGWGLSWLDVGLAVGVYFLSWFVARFAPDLLADRDISRIARQFPLWTVVSLLSPALLGGLITMTWWGALTAFFWAGLVRVAVLHHVTWSVNSICHIVGDRPWTHRDRSTDVWPLAIASMGESWHNLHHADPICARHGVGRGQIDMTARLIWMFEKLGWAHEVRWPTAERLARLRASAQT
jgi:hypothetical protein